MMYGQDPMISGSDSEDDWPDAQPIEGDTYFNTEGVWNADTNVMVDPPGLDIDGFDQYLLPDSEAYLDPSGHLFTAGDLGMST